MTASQTVLFVGASPPDDEYEDPPGVGIARLIERSLRERGYSPDEIDNWRDCGWSVQLAIGDGRFEIALAATTEPDLWMLQIASTNEPGLVARLFGKRATDRSGDVYEVAVAVHEALRSHGYIDLRWRLDGYPDDGESTPEPARRRSN